MGLRERYSAKATDYLERKLRDLQHKARDPRRQRKYENGLNKDEQAEFDILTEILRERIETQQEETKDRIKETIGEEAEQREAPKNTNTRNQAERSNSKLIFETTRDLYSNSGRDIFSASETMEIGPDYRQALNGGKLISDLPEWHWLSCGRAVPTDVNKFYVVHPEHGLNNYLNPGTCSLKDGLVFIKNAAIRPEWAGISHLQHLLFFNGSMQAAIRPQTGDAGGSIGNLSVMGAMAAAEVISKGQLHTTIEIELQRNGIRTAKDLFEIFMTNPDKWLKIVKNLNRKITRKPPLSIDEMNTRHNLLFSFCVTITDKTEIANVSYGDMENQLVKVSDLDMSLIPQQIPWQEIEEFLEIVHPTILKSPILENIKFVKVGDRIHMLCSEKDIGQAPALDPLQIADLEEFKEETRDMLYALDLENIDMSWARYPFPTIEELMERLFHAERVDGKFLAAPDTEEEPRVRGFGNGGNGGNEHSLPRIVAVRNTLLRNRIPAEFTWDSQENRDAPVDITKFDEVEKGHYVLVSLGNLNMQIAVSNDQKLPTYIVHNHIDIGEYNRINTHILKDDFGGTSIRWDSREQFMRSVETFIRQQTEDPKTIYPVNSSYPSPLDTFPNEEARAALNRDMREAATKSGKEPWKMRVGNFKEIRSGNIIWSFGGNACGHAQLDRLARELELVSPSVPQPDFRDRILRIVQYELYPEFRKMQEEKDIAKLDQIL